MNARLRPPAVPLVTVDPYFSVWCMADRLFNENPRHWTGARRGMVGMLRVDGQCWKFLGKAGATPEWQNRGEPPGMRQVSLEVRPLSTVYRFEASGIRLELTFTTPLLLDDLDLLSRPFSYVSFQVRSLDGRKRSVSVYLDVTAEWCVNDTSQQVNWERRALPGGIEALVAGTAKQNVLGSRGDDLRIDWGYLHLIAPSSAQTRIAEAQELRGCFVRSGELGGADAPAPRGATVEPALPTLAARYELSAAPNPAAGLLVLGYDDLHSIEYFHQPLRAWCFRNGVSFGELASRAVREYPEISRRCTQFDSRLTSDACEAVGERYADLVSLAYRQAIAAHKLVADEEGNALFLSKECTSNGCIGTVDVSYPSLPLFLLYAPELVKGMLRPIFRFAASDEWPFEFAPHDVGTYPRANGQVYGWRMGRFVPEGQMPVEECGNMLIMTAAVAQAEGRAAFAQPHWTLLAQWAGYLLEKGFDPENQLCTDDFAGHLARNANLSIKAILGIACFGSLCAMAGRHEEAERFLAAARDMAGRWEREARDGDHYVLAFGARGSWSLKYNLVWDRLLGLNLFAPEIARREVAHYVSMPNRYGVPLDSRASFTKTDWLVWAACLAERPEDLRALTDPIWDFVNETPTRRPFSDWYGTHDALEQSFHHRSVIGGVFLPLLAKQLAHRGT